MHKRIKITSVSIILLLPILGLLPRYVYAERNYIEKFAETEQWQKAFIVAQQEYNNPLKRNIVLDNLEKYPLVIDYGVDFVKQTIDETETLSDAVTNDLSIEDLVDKLQAKQKSIHSVINFIKEVGSNEQYHSIIQHLKDSSLPRNLDGLISKLAGINTTKNKARQIETNKQERLRQEVVETQRQYGSYRCHSTMECKKVFTLTQLYINEFSNMRHSLVTDVLLETYTPREYGALGAKAVRKPGKGNSEIVSLTVICHGLDFNVYLCADRMLSIYKHYPVYIKDGIN